MDMPQVTVEIPDEIMDRLTRWAQLRNTSVEQVAVEHLQSRMERLEEGEACCARLPEAAPEVDGREPTTAGAPSDVVADERSDR